MNSIIGFAFILLCGSVAAQQAADASTAVQECYSPKVWAYCAAQDGSALPPACIDPEEPNPDTSKPKLCASSCSCDKPQPDLATQNQESSVQPPSRSYPPPKLLQWGETSPEEPAAAAGEKSLIKNLKFESSYVPSNKLAEYPEDAETILQQPPVDGTQLHIPDGKVNIDPPSGELKNTTPILDGLPQSGNEMFNPDADSNQNRPMPQQQQTPPPQYQREFKYWQFVPSS